MLDSDSLLSSLLYWSFSLPGSLLSYLAICSCHGLECFLPRESLHLLFAAQVVPAWPGGVPAGLCRSFLPVTLLRKCFFYFLALKSVLVLDSCSISPATGRICLPRLHNPASLYWRLALETKYGPGVAAPPTIFIHLVFGGTLSMRCHGLDTQRARNGKYVLRHAYTHTGVHAVFQPLSIENHIFEFILRTPVLFLSCCLGQLQL